jgi:methyl-accepting chemotaxis protein
VLGWTDEAVQVVADLPQRVAVLVDNAERLVARVSRTLDRVDVAIDRVEQVAARADEVAEGAGVVVVQAAGVADGTDQVVRRIVPITGAAEAVLESVGATSAGAHALLEIFQPMAERGAPLLQHFIDEFSIQELQALIRLIDQVPQFTEHMESDIMPVLAKLDQVGPDVHELLDVLKDVRLAIQGMPGFAMFRRRGADKEDELIDERPETPPPVGRDSAG